jgi:hypothetical protein
MKCYGTKVISKWVLLLLNASILITRNHTKVMDNHSERLRDGNPIAVIEETAGVARQA